MKSKKAAMEMSVGTIVTIVLLMSVLILGFFLIQQIFGSAKGAIDLTDQQLKKQINQLFSANDEKKIIVFPQTRSLEIKIGESDEFAFIINNRESGEETFSYDISVLEIASGCRMTEGVAENLIKLGKSRSGIKIGSGNILEEPLRVKLSIPDTASLCEIRYQIEVLKSDGSIYSQSDIDLTIK